MRCTAIPTAGELPSQRADAFAPKPSKPRKNDVLSAFPKCPSAHLRQHFQAFSQSQKVISGELPYFAREGYASVGQQDFRLPKTPGVEEKLPRRGMTRMVFKRDGEILGPERNPAPFATPAGVDHLLLIGQQVREDLAGYGGPFSLQPANKTQRTDGDLDLVHDIFLRCGPHCR